MLLIRVSRGCARWKEASCASREGRFAKPLCKALGLLVDSCTWEQSRAVIPTQAQQCWQQAGEEGQLWRQSKEDPQGKEQKFGVCKVCLCFKDRDVGQIPCCPGWILASGEQLLLRILGAPLVIYADSSPVKISIAPSTCEFPDMCFMWKPSFLDYLRKAGLPFFGMKQSLHPWKSDNTLH